MTDELVNGSESGSGTSGGEVEQPVMLPGVFSKGSNKESADEPEVEPDNLNAESSNEGEEQEVEQEQPKTKVKFNNKEFQSAEEALKYAERLFKTAQNGQSAAAKTVNELNRRLADLENVVKSGGVKGDGPLAQQVAENAPEGAVSAEVQEFWQDLHKAAIAVDNIKDPGEKHRQSIILNASMVHFMIQQAREEIMQEIAPIKQERELNEANQKILEQSTSVFEQVQSEVNDDGNPVYPELAQPEDLEAIVNMWESYRTQGMPLKLLNHPDHIRMMILAYRQDKTGNVNIPVPSAGNSTSRTVKKQVSPFPKPNLTKAPSGMPGQVIPGVFRRG